MTALSSWISPVPSSVPSSSLSLARVARLLGVLIAVALLFTSAMNYGWTAGIAPAPPVAVAFVVGALAAVSLVVGGVRIGDGTLWGWAVANVALAMGAYLWSSGSDLALQEVRTRTLSSFELIAFTILLADPIARRTARRAIVAATVFAVAVNAYEVTHPMAFSMALGRSAGLYVNPNISGVALVVGLVVGLPAVPARAREAFACVVGAGVFTTLSRGAMLAWAAVLTWMLFTRALKASRMTIALSGSLVAALSLAGILLASGQLAVTNGGAERFVRQRLSIGSSEELNADVSVSSRSQLAGKGLALFAEHPLTGNGTGATVDWAEPESTHNIYVRQLAEYGLLGAWLAPLLLWIGWRAAPEQGAPHGDAGEPSVRVATARGLVLLAALWGFFSHNLFDDAFFLMAFAMLGASEREATT